MVAAFNYDYLFDDCIPLSNHLLPFLNYSDDWDGEFAPRPSLDSIQRANVVVGWVKDSNYEIVDISADVCGGMAIHLNKDDYSVWIACMNSGFNGLVITKEKTIVKSLEISASDKKKFLSYL